MLRLAGSAQPEGADAAESACLPPIAKPLNPGSGPPQLRGGQSTIMSYLRLLPPIEGQLYTPADRVKRKGHAVGNCVPLVYRSRKSKSPSPLCPGSDCSAKGDPRKGDDTLNAGLLAIAAAAAGAAARAAATGAAAWAAAGAAAAAAAGRLTAAATAGAAARGVLRATRR